MRLGEQHDCMSVTLYLHFYRLSRPCSSVVYVYSPIAATLVVGPRRLRPPKWCCEPMVHLIDLCWIIACSSNS